MDTELLKKDGSLSVSCIEVITHGNTPELAAASSCAQSKLIFPHSASCTSE